MKDFLLITLNFGAKTNCNYEKVDNVNRRTYSIGLLYMRI